LIVVVDDEKTAFVEHWRSRGTPGVACFDGWPVGGPKFPAVDIVTEHAHIAETGVHPCPIGHRCFGCVGVLHMQGICWCATVGFLAPHLATGLQVKAQHQPAMCGFGDLPTFASELAPLL